MPLPFSKIIEEFDFSQVFVDGDAFADSVILYFSPTDLVIGGTGLSSVLPPQVGDPYHTFIRRSSDGGQTFTPEFGTSALSGYKRLMMFEFSGEYFELRSGFQDGVVIGIRAAKWSNSSNAFTSVPGFSSQAHVNPFFPWGTVTGAEITSVRRINGLIYVVATGEDSGSNPRSKIMSFDGTDFTEFHERAGVYLDIADNEAGGIVIVGEELVTVWDGISFTDFTPAGTVFTKLVNHNGSVYSLSKQGSAYRIAAFSFNPFSSLSGFTLNFGGMDLDIRDIFSDGSDIYVITDRVASDPMATPKIYKYSLVISQVDEVSFIFPANTYCNVQHLHNSGSDKILIHSHTFLNNFTGVSGQEWRIYEYDYSSPAPTTPVQVTENKLIEVGEPCNEEFAVYLCWLNRLGGRSFWLFDNKADEFDHKIRARSGGRVFSEVNYIDLKKTNVKEIGNSEVKTIKIGADGLDRNRIGSILQIASSPSVAMLISEKNVTPPKWTEVIVRKGSFSYSERNKRLEFEIELPAIYLQQN